jgi:hypothetical protein
LGTAKGAGIAGVVGTIPGATLGVNGSALFATGVVPAITPCGAALAKASLGVDGALLRLGCANAIAGVDGAGCANAIAGVDGAGCANAAAGVIGAAKPPAPMSRGVAGAPLDGGIPAPIGVFGAILGGGMPAPTGVLGAALPPPAKAPAGVTGAILAGGMLAPTGVFG